MALVTYATRIGGLWLLRLLPDSPRLQVWLRAIPGAVLVAIVAPTVLSGSPANLAAAAATVAIARLSGNTLLALIGGVACAAALRALGG